MVETRAGYTLGVNVNTNQVNLTPSVELADVTISYKVDGGVEQTVQSEQSFAVTLPARTIIITLSSSSSEDIGSTTYTIDIERVIYTQIRLFLEGLLAP